MGLGDVPAERILPEELIVSMKRLFSAYEAHREDPARLLALDVFNWEDVMVNTIYADGLQLSGWIVSRGRYPVNGGR